MEITATADEIARERLENPKVASTRLRKQEKEFMSEISWTVSRAIVDLIKADLFGKNRPAGVPAIPALETIKIP
jgi:hypothetical protein